MNANLQFTLNGKLQRVSTDSQRTLLEVLREDLDLTGTKYGCGEGQCRACTVLLDGNPVRSCLTEVTEVEGHTVETIEGLARNGALHPVQEAFVKEQIQKQGLDPNKAFDGAVRKSLDEQAEKKGFTIEK